MNPWIIALYVFYGAMIGYSIYVARKQPRNTGQKPPGIEEINVPVAEEGREIPLLVGTRDLNGPNVSWYGSFRTQAIKKKV